MSSCQHVYLADTTTASDVLNHFQGGSWLILVALNNFYAKLLLSIYNFFQII